MELRFLCPRSAADAHGYDVRDADAWIEPHDPPESFWHVELTYLKVELTLKLGSVDDKVFIFDMGDFANGLSIYMKETRELRCQVRGDYEGSDAWITGAGEAAPLDEVFTLAITYDAPDITTAFQGDARPPYTTPVEAILQRPQTPAIGRATQAKADAWGGDPRSSPLTLVKLTVSSREETLLDWRLQEGVGTAIQDHTGNGLFGMPHGGSWVWV